jgi:ribosomal protein S18 acetylase RimI-like enzyme
VIEVRRLTPADESAADDFLAAELGGRNQARLDELVDVLALPGFGAFDSDTGALVGVATYDIGGERAELAALGVSSAHRRQGIATSLIEAVVAEVAAQHVRDLWLVTTNDNVDALRLYQRLGFRLVELRRDAITRSRRLKPAIPEVGDHGIPMRDELVLSTPVPTTGGVGHGRTSGP